MVGPPLIRRLLAGGWSVRALVHEAQPGSAAIDIVRGDIRERRDVIAAARDVDVVFHLAGKLHETRVDADAAEAMRAVNGEGTRNVVEALPPSARLIYFSTINVYGTTLPPDVADENTRPNPLTPYARTKLEGEAIALASGRACVLRLAAVYGPGMKGNYVRLIKAIRRNRFLPLGTSENRRTLIHVHDAVRAAELAVHLPAGEILNLTDGRIHTLGDILAAMYSAMRRRPPLVHVPVIPARAIAAAFDRVTPLHLSSSIDKYLEDLAVSGAKAMRMLSFKPEVALAEGWRTVVAEMLSDA